MQKKTKAQQQALLVSAAFGAGALGLLLVVIALYRWGSGNMWAGAIGGGIVALAVLALGTWRSTRHPEKATIVDRSVAIGPVQDERDKTILTHAAATVGYLALPLTAAATIAFAVGAPALPTLTILLYTQMSLAVGAFVYQVRKN